MPDNANDLSLSQNPATINLESWWGKLLFGGANLNGNLELI